MWTQIKAVFPPFRVDISSSGVLTVPAKMVIGGVAPLTVKFMHRAGVWNPSLYGWVGTTLIR
jgi:hypothetical protein